MKNFYKILPIVILLLFVVTCVSMNVFASETTYELGDVNADEQINATDALEVLKHAAKISSVDATVADINKNGTIDAADALWILKYAARLISDFSDETLNATPVPTVTPVPTATPVPVDENIKLLKNHIKTNGQQEDNIYYIGYYVGNNDTTAYMVYYSDEDLLQMEFSYYNETASGDVSNIELYMPITGTDTQSLFYFGYATANDYGYIEASAPITPSTFTSNTNINYTTISSSNADDSDLSSIYADASDLTIESIYLWNDLIIEEVNFGLKELGFSNL